MMQPPDSTAKRDRLLLRAGLVTLVLLYLVIVAGSVVRATGSGMGCPDWPKCFGFYIPPTDSNLVAYHPGKDYKKGHMVIVNDTLWRAPADFTGSTSFNRSQWEKYPTHNYAKFNALHTWVEYINRLIGALSGFGMLIMLAIALTRFRRDKGTVLWLLLGMVVLGYIAWLGKVVVDNNLAPLKITMHMMSALAIVAIVLVVNNRLRKQVYAQTPAVTGNLVMYGLVFLLALTLAQIIAGTQVRQEVDTLYKLTGNTGRDTWTSQLSGTYSIHQLLALLVVALNGMLYWMLRRLASLKRGAAAIILLLLAEYAIGVILHRAGIPASLQPLHVVIATVVFGLQFWLLLRMKRK
ncbi:MAG: COX15/CtaA family protein [Bacteroidetes bacterium]|nr:COX15/CtaA family protein [Bacteroidota bacterium]